MLISNKTITGRKAARGRLALLLLVGLLFVFPVSHAGASDATFGDINSNGPINVSDVTIAMRYALGLETLTAAQRELADVNLSGSVNVQDVVLIMQYALGLIDQFEADEQDSDCYIVAGYNQDSIGGHRWPAGASVTVRVNGFSAVVDADSEGSFTLYYWDYDDLELNAGDAVTATDGEIIKTHFIREVRVLGYDTDANTLSGTAPAGSDIVVRVFDAERDYSDLARRRVVTRSDGTWTADFSSAIGTELSESAYDINLNSTGEARFNDLRNDATVFYWHVAEPIIEAMPADDSLRGYAWIADAVIAVSVGESEYVTTADSSGYFIVENVTLNAGDKVKVTDGTRIKEHLVTALQITGVDRSAGSINGVAGAGTEVLVELLEPLEGQPGRPKLIDDIILTAGADGSWSASFNRLVSGNVYYYAAQTDYHGDRTVAVD